MAAFSRRRAQGRLIRINARGLSAAEIKVRPHTGTGEPAMDKNIGAVDRVLRALVGLALIAYAIPVGFPATGWNWVGWIGVIPFVTGAVGNCPLYSLLGIASCPRKPA